VREGDTATARNPPEPRRLAGVPLRHARAQGTTARPLDGDVLSFGRARAPVKGPAAAPLPSFAPAKGSALGDLYYQF